MVELDRKVQKFGGTYYIGIPLQIAQHLKIKEGDKIKIDEIDGKIIMKVV